LRCENVSLEKFLRLLRHDGVGIFSLLRNLLQRFLAIRREVFPIDFLLFYDVINKCLLNFSIRLLCFEGFSLKGFNSQISSLLSLRNLKLTRGQRVLHDLIVQLLLSGNLLLLTGTNSKKSVLL